MFGIPSAVVIMGISLHVYGLMYLLGAIAAYYIGSRYVAPARGLRASGQALQDVIFWTLVGGVLGGRIWFSLFYSPDFFQDPLGILRLWEGGMSIHGGFLGGALGLLLSTRRHGLPIVQVADVFAAGLALALAFGRFGNLANGELPGRETTSFLGVTYPDGSVRHLWPAYAIFKDLLLFLLLLIASYRFQRIGVPIALFFLGIGLFRFIAEFWREPDPQLGFVLWNWVSMGQIMALLTMFIGVVILSWSLQRKR